MRGWTGVVVAAAVVIATLMVLSGGAGGSGSLAQSRQAENGRSSGAAGGAVGTGVELPIGVTPGAICATVGPTTESCSVNAYTSDLSLGLDGSGNGTAAWPAVQMLFLAQTTILDGVYRPGCMTGYTPNNTSWCPTNQTYGVPPVSPIAPNYEPIQGASNLLPTFVNNSYAYTEAIQAAHPLTRMTFGFLDFFATHSKWDPGGGTTYHVDVSNFLPPGEFASMLNRTFRTEVLGPSPSDLTLHQTEFYTQNFLSTDVITAMYGALEGVGVNWSPETHHVLVWMGASLPRYQPTLPSNPWDNMTLQYAFNWANTSANLVDGKEHPVSQSNFTYPTGLNFTGDMCSMYPGVFGEPFSTWNLQHPTVHFLGPSGKWQNFLRDVLYNGTGEQGGIGGSQGVWNLSRYNFTSVASYNQSQYDTECYTSTCEPSYTFTPTVVSPKCEGWVTPTGGTTTNSIAELARTAPECVDSLGGNCTIDVIESNSALSIINPDNIGGVSTFTYSSSGFYAPLRHFPYSEYFAWYAHFYPPSTYGINCRSSSSTNCPFLDGPLQTYTMLPTLDWGTTVNSYLIFLAGCSIASATGGTWDGTGVGNGVPILNSAPQGLVAGPYNTTDINNITYMPYYWEFSTYSCEGRQGNLPAPPVLYENLTGVENPMGWTNWSLLNTVNASMNASFLPAFEGLGVGYPTGRLVASGGTDGSPMVTVALHGAFRIAPFETIHPNCVSTGPYPVDCTGATVQVSGVNGGGATVLTWNLSADPNENFVAAGELITLEVPLLAMGPPYNASVPVDACETPRCLAEGSGELSGGVYTSVLLTTAASGGAEPERYSYGLAELTVLPPPQQSPPPGTTTPPPTPTPPPSPVAGPPVTTPVPTPGPLALPTVGISVSTVGIAGGLIAAGVTRSVIGNKSERVAVAMRVRRGDQRRARTLNR